MVKSQEEANKYMNKLVGQLRDAFNTTREGGFETHISIMSAVLGCFIGPPDMQERFCKKCAEWSVEEMSKILEITPEEFDKRYKEDPETLKKDLLSFGHSLEKTECLNDKPI